MSFLLSALRPRYCRSIEDRTTLLEPSVRKDLQREIESVLHVQNMDHDLTTEFFEHELEQTRRNLTKFEDSERFLALRIHSYRRNLEERAHDLGRMKAAVVQRRITDKEQQQQHEQEERIVEDDVLDDAETGQAEFIITSSPEQLQLQLQLQLDELERELEAKQIKLQKDQEALSAVMETQRSLLADIERMRRHLRDLEKKRDVMLSRQEECRSFMVAAAIIADDDDDDDVADEEDQDEFEDLLQEESSSKDVAVPVVVGEIEAVVFAPQKKKNGPSTIMGGAAAAEPSHAALL